MDWTFGLGKKKETAADRQAWLEGSVREIGERLMSQRISDLRGASRSFEAAETPAWTDSWPTNAGAINEDLARQLPTLVARSRGMARNNEWAIGYLLKLNDNVLGESGIRLQMRLKKRGGTQDNDSNDYLEGGWDSWGRNADVSGISWPEIESLVLRSLVIDGELLYRFRTGVGPYGFQIQLLDPTLIDVALRRDWGGNRVRMGVEIDDDGRPVAYWLRMSRAGDSPSEYITVGRHVRVPASELRHCFLRSEVGQLRGIPWLSGGARRLWLLKDFEESAAVASSNAAKRQGFFVSPTGEAPPGFADTMVSSVLETARAQGRVLSAEEMAALTAAAEKYATTMPGQYDTLPLGYDFRAFTSMWPNIEAGSYIKGQLRGWSVARGMSYVTAGNDLESVNYSSARVGIVGEREHFKFIQQLLVRFLHAPVLEAALPWIILRNPALRMDRKDIYLVSATWQPRRWPGIDPVKEAQANEINLRLRLTSRRRICLERGEDPDEIAGEVAEEEKLYGPVDKTTTEKATTAAEAQDAEEAAAAENKSQGRHPLVAVREHQ